MDSLQTPRSITSLDGSCYEAIDLTISQNIFSYLKMFHIKSMHFLAMFSILIFEDNKLANFINICINIYISILYVTRMTQNKNDSINSTLQRGLVVDKNCCVVFPTSGFLYFTLCPRQCKWKVANTYVAIRTKNNKDIWVWKSPAVKASTN